MTTDAFETAADAIVEGDAATLSKLLRAEPGLVQERSSRAHRSTLLHYVSANGVEDVRQKTPPNIVAIAQLLLDAGADVQAESEAYGGRSTVLGLTATSCHPENAGVQIALMGLLVSRGAAVDTENAVNSCLRNGRGAAAVFLANHGARLDLEGAAGIGCLDLVQSLFDASDREQRRIAMSWSCEYGHLPVVECLLDRGAEIGSGLHWAAYSGEIEIMNALLRRHADVNARDERFDASPLGWVIHAWRHRPAAARPALYQAAALLVEWGAIQSAEESLVMLAENPRSES